MHLSHQAKGVCERECRLEIFHPNLTGNPRTSLNEHLTSRHEDFKHFLDDG